MDTSTLRLPYNVVLYNEKGEVVKKYHGTKKSQIRLKVTDVPRSEWASGSCRVWYNRKDDYWNEFLFDSVSKFNSVLTQVTEKDLLVELAKDGSLDKSYLEKAKRPISDQRRKELRARMKQMRAKL